MRFLQFGLGSSAREKHGWLRLTLIGTALAGAVMLSGAGPVSAAVPAEPETGAPAAASGPSPTAVATTAAATPAATLVTLAPGLTGFDNIGADTSAQLSCLSDSGYTFDVIDALGAGWDSEYRSAAALGLSVVLFQGFYKPYWTDPAQGTARGQLMVSNAQLVGYPRGAQVFLNLEDNLTDGVTPTTRPGIIQWVQNWAAAVKAAGYTPGVYVGNPQILTADDLTSALTTVSVFWRSASSSAPQSGRGYVLRQPSISAAACGTTIDIDTSGSDNSGAGLVGAGFPRGLTSPATAGALGPLTPSRIMDTRGGGTLGVTGTTAVQIRGAGGVPTAGVSAVAINVTAVNPTDGGYLTVWPSDRTRPTASNLNFAAGQTVPNLVVVPVGSDGKINIFNGSFGTVDVIVDVAGYYMDGTPTAAGTLGPLTPSRIMDTRSGGTLGVTGTTTVQILGAGGVPTTGVSAVAINVTAVNPTDGGYLTVWPSDRARPTASNLNFAAGQTVPNMVVVPVGSDGKINIFNGSFGTVDVIVDVAGYYMDGTPTAAGTLGPLTPSRILDTRSGGTLGGRTAQALKVTGRGGVPASGVSAVMVNLTAVGPVSDGYLTAGPSGTNLPNASNLNFVHGRNVANLAVVPVGTDGKIMLFNGSTAPVDLIADVVGYVAG